MDPEFFDIEQLKQVGLWPFDFLPAYGIIPYINRYREETVGIEIGVLKGETSHELLSACPRIKKLYGVDPYKGYQDLDRFRTEEDMKRYQEICNKNMNKFADRFELIVDSSENSVNRFSDNSIDFIFIDGQQTYDSVKNELQSYYPKIKSRGMIFGHDGNLENIIRAYKDFRNENKIRTPLCNSKNFVWFWYKN